MADYVEKYADKASDELEKQIKRVYKQAAEEVQKKLDDFIRAHKARDAEMSQKVASGELSEQNYKKWMQGQVFQGKQWRQKLKDVTDVYVHADERAREIVGKSLKNVFMESANYTAYDIEKGMRGAVAFNVYDAKTVERLLKDNPKMLPEWKIDQPKDYTWNEKRVRNAVTQGIIQGESIEKVGSRLTEELATSNAKKMDMFARTAVNGAQNAGRMDRLHEAEDMGIEVKKKWLATLDNRTRDTHQALDGQEQPVDEPFVVDGMKIDYPGDPFAPPELVYNCRCTLTYVYPKYQHLQHNHERRDQLNDKNIENMTYYEWVGLASKNDRKQEEPEPEEPKQTEESVKPEQGENIVSGIDITTPRYDAFSSEIADKIPEWAEKIKNSELPKRSEQFEYYKKAKTETDKELMEFLAQLESNVLSYRNESKELQREHAEIFSVLSKPYDGKLYRGESGDWVKTYGDFKIGKTITFDHLSFTSPETKTPFAHTGVIWEFESGTKSINFVGQDNIDNDELILGNFVIVKVSEHNGVPLVTLRQKEGISEDLPTQPLNPSESKDASFVETEEKEKVKCPYTDEMSSKGYVGLSAAESDEFIKEHHNKRIVGKKGSNTMDGSQSRRINTAFRNDETPTNPADVKLVQKLDAEINKNELPQDMTLFRGVSLDAFSASGVFDGFKKTTVEMSDFKDASGNIDFDKWGKAYEEATDKDLEDKLSRAKKLIGTTIEDKGYMQVSASSQRNIFAASEIGLQIHTPKGTNAYISDYQGESEIILGRGTSYRVLDATIATTTLENGNKVKNIQLIVETVDESIVKNENQKEEPKTPEKDEKTFKQKDAYTESEKEAIHEYTTSSYSGVNSALREGTVKDYESVKRIVDKIDSAMEKTVVSEGTVASRGASMADLRGMFEGKRRSWFEDPDNLKSLEGQTATFKSYISTTKGESVAEPYKRELQWHFTTKGDVHGIDAEQFASSSVKSEREIVFDRDAQIEIEKVKVNVDSDGDIDGVVEIWAKIKGSKQEEQTETPDASYQYHATTAKSIIGIAEKGLQPNRGHVGKGIYFADNVKDALDWVDTTSTGGKTVLRVSEEYLEKDKLEKYSASETGYGLAESVYDGKVPLEHIQIKVNDNGDEDDWWSLAQYLKNYKSKYNSLDSKTKKKVDEIVSEETDRRFEKLESKEEPQLSKHTVTAIDDYIEGRGNKFTKNEVEEIKTNMTKTEKTLYRVEDLSWMAESLENGDKFEFDKPIKSFTHSYKSIKDVIAEGVDAGLYESDVLVIYETVDDTYQLDVSSMSRNHEEEEESFVSGKFEVVDQEEGPIINGINTWRILIRQIRK